VDLWQKNCFQNSRMEIRNVVIQLCQEITEYVYCDMVINTRWFKYDRDWFVCKLIQISPGHIWTTLYIHSSFRWYTAEKQSYWKSTALMINFHVLMTVCICGFVPLCYSYNTRVKFK
jgi:hypothetical protein